MVGYTICLANWVRSFLICKFFDPCPDHHDLRKNEKNMFCIDCGIGICKHCLDSFYAHTGHQFFQICKYVYHDVVRLQDIQKHLNCSKIQTYKINGEKAVHLNPRRQLKDAKTTNSKGGTSCVSCGRYIQDWPNSYCSISCKVSSGEDIAMTDAENDNIWAEEGKFDIVEYSAKEKEWSSCISEASGPEVFQEELIMDMHPKTRRRRRKGVPTRAPLF